VTKSPIGEKLQAMADGPMVGGIGKVRKRGKVVARGYAAAPGTGPDGETCRSCANRYGVTGGRKTFWKCRLAPRFSCGPATDIRLGWPACVRWAATDPHPASPPRGEGQK